MSPLCTPRLSVNLHSVYSHQKVTAERMNGVSWPQRLPSHLAGLLVALGSEPGMQGMVQWMIRRKFPAAQRKLRNNSVMGNNWKKK